MPRSSDDDAPRWELPQWEDLSQWEEPPPRSPSANVPRWEPEREVPRAQPRRGPTRGTPRGVRVEPPPRSAPVPNISPFARPFVWWAAHPWIILWVLVCLAPGAVVLLRTIDESGFEPAVPPLAWVFGGLLVVALARAMLASARRPVTRLVFGTITALAALGTLLWPVTQVTLGHTACPARAGTNLGASVATATLDAWRRGSGGEEGWRNGQVDGDWRDRSRALSLLDYQLVATGCWERVAPIDGTRTWHEFRVTVREREQAPLSKSLVVHTAVGSDGWKITAIEGPLP